MDFQKGYTLLELMIAVVIIGVLSSVAYSSYADSVKKSRRADAISALMTASLKMEQCLSDNGSYTSCAPGMTVSDNGYYDIETVVPSGGMSYQLSATPKAGKAQENDASCTEFTLNSMGVKGYGGAAPTATECWGK